MNFVFVIDSSVSMSQTFEGISYFEAAKSAIHNFVLKREISNSKTKNKSDRYFLLGLNEKHKPFSELWSESTEHFIYQLKSLKQTYDFTNIENAIKTSFNLLNYTRKIGYEKHIYGRQFSKIHNSFIILITDGGDICSSKRVFGKGNNFINLISAEGETQEKKTISLYNEIFRWDQSFYAIILGYEKSAANSFLPIKQCVENVGGSVYFANNWEILNEIISDLAEITLSTNRVYAQFYCKNFTQKKNSKKKNKNVVTSIESLVPIESLIDKWPFPDEILITKEFTHLPKKKALPLYIISPLCKFNFSIKPDFYDEYNLKLLDEIFSSETLKVLTVQNFIDENTDNFYFDVLIDFNNRNNMSQSPFAVIKVTFNPTARSHIINYTNKQITLSDYYYDNLSKLNHNIKCSFINLPYNYPEFVSIITNAENGALSKPELHIQIEKYFVGLPFYYKLYVAYFLEKKNLWSVNLDTFQTKIELENISESVINEIKNISQTETDTLKKINSNYSKNKQEHINKTAKCCMKENLYRNKSKDELVDHSLTIETTNSSNVKSKENYKNFLKKCLDINKELSQNSSKSKDILTDDKKVDNKIQALTKKFNEIDIELMGNYRDYLIRTKSLKSNDINDNEIKYLVADLFGNQFKTRKEIYQCSFNFATPDFQEESIYIEPNNPNNPETKEELSMMPEIGQKHARDDDQTSVDTKSLTQDFVYSSLSEDESNAEIDLSKESINDFINQNVFENYENSKDNVTIVNKFKISSDQLYNWKLNLQIKKLSRKFINCFKGKEDIVQLINEILKMEYLFTNKEKKINFLTRVLQLSEDYDMDRISIKKIKTIINSIMI